MRIVQASICKKGIPFVLCESFVCYGGRLLNQISGGESDVVRQRRSSEKE